jgi:hypothetical protein
MSHFANVVDGIVVQVIVAEQDFIDLISNNTNGIWIQTSYNTHGGEHLLGGVPLRKNYAAVGYTYDNIKDAFIPPKPFNSWVLNESTCIWESPIPSPSDEKNYEWDEATLNWIEVT